MIFSCVKCFLVRPKDTKYDRQHVHFEKMLHRTAISAQNSKQNNPQRQVQILTGVLVFSMFNNSVSVMRSISCTSFTKRSSALVISFVFNVFMLSDLNYAALRAALKPVSVYR